ncbi:hypothetical protein G9A89_002733 [Geosiphon pyriformis]|nr:hypothetical protein G9A89_002733 [Geosiphon pyriformis]
MWNYVVTAHKPSTILGLATGSFTSPDVTNLIIQKLTRIEIYILAPEGLKSFFDFPVYDRIACMLLFHPEGRKTDLLFVTTESYQFFVISFDPTTDSIVTEGTGDLSQTVGTPVESGQLCAIDPECRLIGLHIYQGIFKVIPLETATGAKKRVTLKGLPSYKEPSQPGQPKDAFNLRLEELQISKIEFLHQTPVPTLLILYLDVYGIPKLKTYFVHLREEEFSTGPFHLDDAGNVLAIAAFPTGGFITFSDLKITFFNKEFNERDHMLSKAMPIRAVARIDQDGSRYFIGDDKGDLHLLIMSEDGDMNVEFLGKTSISQCIAYLDNGFAFVGSHFHDSLLIKLRPQPDELGWYFDVFERFTNLAPIADFCVVDLERQGQGQIVTCSGAFQDGTLRIIRNGVGITEQAMLEMRGIRGLWSLRSNFDSENDSTIVISFTGETRVLTMTEGEEMHEVEEFCNFQMNKMTLCTGNMLGDYLVQITEDSIRLINSQSQIVTSQWYPPFHGSKITVASVSPSQIVVALGGGLLIYLEVRGTELFQVQLIKFPYEISCLSINPFEASNPYKSSLVAVGFWTEISVAVLAVPDLELVAKEFLGGQVIPRSILFATFDNVHYLLAALGDGQLLHFILDPIKKELRDKRKLLLGTQPVMLTTFMSNGTTNVFASSDRPTVIYSSNKKLLYSNVNAKEVTHMCPFNSASFPNALAISHEEGLTIGTIDDISKLHIRTVTLNEMPRRICYQESTSTFGVLTVRAFINEETHSFFRILDDHTFDMLDQHMMEVGEVVQCLTTLRFHETEDAAEFFAVGTAISIPNQDDCRKGRILIFLVEKTESTQTRKLRLITASQVMGAVYSLAPLNQYLVASINAKITVYKLNSLPDSGTFDLVPICSYCGFTLIYCIITRGDFIIVGDLMRSITLLLYKPMEQKIEEIAKDHSLNWISAVEAIDDDHFVACDTSYNLFTLRKNSDATSEDERGKLDEIGLFHIGDMVNRFRHGSLAMNLPETDPTANPELLYCTVSGAIGVIATVSERKHSVLRKLQDALQRLIEGIGDLNHERWRAFRNERRTEEARKYLDGDLIETYLDLSRKQMEQIAMETGHPVEDLFKTVEELTRIH